jgi:RHS repeat-associated protein
VLGPDEGNALQYTGRENDGTGLYYYRARYYDPGLKRFISEDPIGTTAGLNFYSYVEGNPISFSDPTGLIPNCTTAILGVRQRDWTDTVDTIIAQWSMIGFYPTSTTVGGGLPDLSRGRRQPPPGSPSVQFEIWLTEHTVSYQKVVQFHQVIQRLLVTCIETINERCGRSRTETDQFERNKALTPTQKTIREGLHYDVKRIRRLGNTSIP